MNNSEINKVVQELMTQVSHCSAMYTHMQAPVTENIKHKDCTCKSV
jgi:hypothetical protein